MGSRFGTGLKIAGLIAALALVARGVLDLRQGGGWTLFLIAAAILTALALRHFVYRD